MNMPNQNKNGLYTENGHTYAYIDGKRVAGYLKDNNWLVLTESIHQPDLSWVHSCGTTILYEHITRPIWETNMPVCSFCHTRISQPLPDDLLLCPNCQAPRTGNVLGLKRIDMPYCPKCEPKPKTILPKWLVERAESARK